MSNTVDIAKIIKIIGFERKKRYVVVYLKLNFGVSIQERSECEHSTAGRHMGCLLSSEEG